MPITITKRILSGSTHGTGILVTATQGATINTIHALSTSATTTIDEIYVYAQNNYSRSINVVFEFGTSQTNAHLTCPVEPLAGPQLLLPGLPLTGSACSVLAFVNGLGGSASPALSGSSLVSIYGYVNRLVQT